jgi:hypothetical protein
MTDAPTAVEVARVAAERPWTNHMGWAPSPRRCLGIFMQTCAFLYRESLKQCAGWCENDFTAPAGLE